MIGIIVLTLLVTWIWLSKKIASGIMQLIAGDKVTPFARVLLQAFIIIIPFIDEIVGRIQFQQLCASEAVVWISPDIKKVIAAHEGDSGISPRRGYIFPIREQVSIYLDAYTSEPFYKFKAFHTPGGWVMRSGLNLGNSSSCWPEKWTSGQNGFDLDAMLKKGELVELPK